MIMQSNLKLYSYHSSIKYSSINYISYRIPGRRPIFRFLMLKKIEYVESDEHIGFSESRMMGGNPYILITILLIVDNLQHFLLKIKSENMFHLSYLPTRTLIVRTKALKRRNDASGPKSGAKRTFRHFNSNVKIENFSLSRKSLMTTLFERYLFPN